MKVVLTDAFMRQTLSRLLLEGESLRTPFVCALLILNGEPAGYDCFVDWIGNDLLLAATQNFISVSSDRMPFHVKNARMKKTFLGSHDITIGFANGGDIRIIADEKPLLGGFTEQKRNVLAFLDKLHPYG
jgi:hypothetical protein